MLFFLAKIARIVALIYWKKHQKKKSHSVFTDNYDNMTYFCAILINHGCCGSLPSVRAQSVSTAHIYINTINQIRPLHNSWYFLITSSVVCASQQVWHFVRHLHPPLAYSLMAPPTDSYTKIGLVPVMR